MAHRFERGALRAARHAAGRGVRALSGAALVLTLAAATAGAQAPGGATADLARSGLPDAASWWGEPGRAGWAPDLWLGAAAPWTLGGFARGAWSAAEPGRAPQQLPFPGIGAARAPLGWADTLAVGPGGPGAWLGYGAALAAARAEGALVNRRARASLVFGSGSQGFDDNALSVTRGDSVSYLRAETASGTRGAAGALEDAGRHLWGVGARLTRGRHRLDGSFAQRGEAGKLHDGREQAAAGESGELAWRYGTPTGFAGLALARGFSRHESFGGALALARREAQEVVGKAEWERALAGRVLGARLEWRRGEVKRFGESEDTRHATAVWGAARLEAPLAGGRVELTLGGGRHDAVKRTDVAPGVAWSFAGSAVRGRLALERLLEPVWADLPAGQAPYLQHTWALTARGALAGSGPFRAEAALFTGHARGRALAARLPLEALWLRAGFRPDTAAYDFALASAGLAWRGTHAGAGLEGFALARTAQRTLQPRVDPPAGGRAFVEGSFALFEGDLGVTLRAEADAIGPREAETAPVRRLDGYPTFGGAVVLTLADATITVRARNLEDRQREQTWVDAATGRPALGPGRELRMTLTWRLFN
ncbi:MAG: hypothetical protein HZC42_02920 [Candidatus Eisenbacteria bacterium]|nr:hypothetical protein [Candidatus Eisenbacteria bacterium]